MRKISMLYISLTILGLLMLLGCNRENITILQMEPQPQSNKLDNDDKVSEVDWKSKYKVISKAEFHVLIDEYIDNNSIENPDTTILVRDYWCFDGTGKWREVYPVTDRIFFRKLNEIKSVLDLKNYMKKLDSSSDCLKLKKNTIISDTVLNQWREQGYVTDFEYSKESPQGLTYEMLEKSIR